MPSNNRISNKNYSNKNHSNKNKISDKDYSNKDHSKKKTCERCNECKGQSIMIRTFNPTEAMLERIDRLIDETKDTESRPLLGIYSQGNRSKTQR
mmetsp:Transcript_16217/g.29162  ORF Transcript_16217/g.29162 Transcript_16217/m.29162 type:complete len:95 (-) Transcript_16217:1243-1527(-)